MTIETINAVAIRTAKKILMADQCAGWCNDDKACETFARFLVNDYQDVTGKPFVFDAVAWRCEFSLYDSLEQFNRKTGQNVHSIEEIRGQGLTDVIELTNGRFIARDF